MAKNYRILNPGSEGKQDGDVYTLGYGVKEYTGELLGDTTPFQQEKFEIKPYELSGSSLSSTQYIDSESQLEETLSNTIGFDVGFPLVNIGLKRDSNTTIKITNHTVCYISIYKQECEKQVLEDYSLILKEGTEIPDTCEGSAAVFYKTHGSRYISSITRGIYAYVLIHINCSSESEVTSVKNELNTKMIADGGTAELTMENGQEINNWVESKNGKMIGRDNISSEVKTELGYKIGDIKSQIELVSQAANLGKEYARPMAKGTTPYKSETLIQRQIDNIINDKELHIYDALGKCDEQLDIIDAYNNNIGNYYAIADIDDKENFWSEQRGDLAYIMTRLNNNLYYNLGDVDESTSSLSEDLAKAIGDKNENINNKVVLSIKKLDMTFHVGTSEMGTINKCMDNVINTMMKKGGEHSVVKYAVSPTIAKKFSGPKPKANGAVFYSEEIMQIPRKQPTSGTSWNFKTFLMESGHSGSELANLSVLCERIVLFMNTLTATQIFYSSITLEYDSAQRGRIDLIYPDM